jgi:hypothetical protein
MTIDACWELAFVRQSLELRKVVSSASQRADTGAI